MTTRRCSLVALTLLACVVAHARARLCTDKVCYFELTVTRGSSMTYRVGSSTYNVVLVGRRLKIVENSYHKAKDDKLIGTFVPANKVLTVDGFARNLFLVNGKFPGENIEVIFGAQVVVKVTNLLLMDGITVHWHGLTMEKTPWMDGVGAHGQCPIQPLTSFTYRFKATPVGTHWYHDHYENQRRCGLFGAVIIHPTDKAPNTDFEFITFIGDWYHAESEQTNMASPSRIGHPGTGQYNDHNDNRDFAIDGSEISAVTYKSSLINGRGSYKGLKAPHTIFSVKRRSLYRFRVINAASERSYIVSVDKHDMWILSLDGSDIVPVQMDFITVHPGEQLDFQIRTTANPRIRQYWWRSCTLRAGVGPTLKKVREQCAYAVVRYPGAKKTALPKTKQTRCTAAWPCKVFNCPFGGYPKRMHRKCVSVDEMTSGHSQEFLDRELGLQDKNVQEMFFNWAPVGLGTSVNGRKTIGAQGVPLYQDDFAQYITPCNKTECDAKGCVCTYFVSLPYNKTVRFIYTNYNPMSDEVEHHPVHMHGVHFAVVKIGYPKYNKVTGRRTVRNPDIVCPNNMCSAPRWSNGRPKMNFNRPPLRETIIVPSGGYAVAQFRTTNPGLWFIHCHMASHAIEGMGFYLFEAVPQIPKVPPNFPRCSHYEFTQAQYEQYQAKPGYVPTEDNAGWGASAYNRDLRSQYNNKY